jgi:hypothetical protein
MCRDVGQNDEVFGDDGVTGGSSGEEGRFRIVQTGSRRNGSLLELGAGWSMEQGARSMEHGARSWDPM